MPGSSELRVGDHLLPVTAILTEFSVPAWVHLTNRATHDLTLEFARYLTTTSHRFFCPAGRPTDTLLTSVDPLAIGIAFEEEPAFNRTSRSLFQ